MSEVIKKTTWLQKRENMITVRELRINITWFATVNVLFR